MFRFALKRAAALAAACIFAFSLIAIDGGAVAQVLKTQTIHEPDLAALAAETWNPTVAPDTVIVSDIAAGGIFKKVADGASADGVDIIATASGRKYQRQVTTASGVSALLPNADPTTPCPQVDIGAGGAWVPTCAHQLIGANSGTADDLTDITATAFAPLAAGVATVAAGDTITIKTTGTITNPSGGDLVLTAGETFYWTRNAAGTGVVVSAPDHVAYRETFASTANGKGASLVGVEDSAGLYSSSTVEGALAEIGGASRTRLAANRTYYWGAGGSDSNDCLSSGARCLTFAAAIEKIRAIDFNGYQVVLQAVDADAPPATLTERLIVHGPFIGQKFEDSFIIRGDTTTPANFVLSPAAFSTISVAFGARAQIEGFKVQSTTQCAQVWTGARVRFGKMTWDSCAAAGIQAADGYALFVGPQTVTASMPIFGVAEVGNGNIDFGSQDFTHSGAITYSTAFLNVGENSHIGIHAMRPAEGNHWLGTNPSGTQYIITNSGEINGNSQIVGDDLAAIPGTAGSGIIREKINYLYGKVTVNPDAESSAVNGVPLTVIGTGGSTGVNINGNSQIGIYNNGIQAGISIASNTAGDAVFFMGDSASHDRGRLQYSNASDEMYIHTAGALQTVVRSNGNYDVLNGGIKIGSPTGGSLGAGTVNADVKLCQDNICWSVGTTAPATCTKGDLFSDTDGASATTVFAVCTATNTWTFK